VEAGHRSRVTLGVEDAGGWASGGRSEGWRTGIDWGAAARAGGQRLRCGE
jgi:hypothetical protein